MINRQFLMAQRPSGPLKISDFSLVERSVPALRVNEVLIQVSYTLIEPIIRGWMVNWFGFTPMDIGSLIPSAGVGTVIDSRNPAIVVGSIVSGMYGWQEYAITDGTTIPLDCFPYGDQIMPFRKYDSELPMSYPIGVLGVSSMTAYFGVIRDAPPTPGKTYLVSGAAGAVGSIAGQIAKMHGAVVIGLAGTDEKCAWLQNECRFDHAINYRLENVENKIQRYCPDGVHTFFDNVGGPILDLVLNNMARGAMILLCGATSVYNSETNQPEWGPKNYYNLCLTRSVMKGTYCVDFHAEYPQAQEDLVDWIKLGKLAHRETFIEGFRKLPSSFDGPFPRRKRGKSICARNWVAYQGPAPRCDVVGGGSTRLRCCQCAGRPAA